jgi:hypothetical protein
MILTHRRCCAACVEELRALREKLEDLAGVPEHHLEAAVDLRLADARRELAWKGQVLGDERGYRRKIARRLANNPAEVRQLLAARRPEILARAVGTNVRP